MNYVFGALAGLLWGALAAFVNFKINQAALKRSTNASMMGANLARTGVDLVALGTVFLLRKVLPFSFEAAIIATAIALSILTVVSAYRLTKPGK